MAQHSDVTSRPGDQGARGARMDAGSPRFRITAVRVRGSEISVSISDGTTVDWPVRRVPEVSRARPDARQGWELTLDGTGINWPALSSPQSNGLLSVWEILEERLYDDALRRGLQMGWNLGRMSVADAQLIALWRLSMDLVFGSYLQFRCSWDDSTILLAREALAELGASEMAALLDAMDRLTQKYPLPRDVVADRYLHTLLTGSDNDRLQELEFAFWELAGELPRLVVESYTTPISHEGRAPQVRSHGGLTGATPRVAAS